MVIMTIAPIGSVTSVPVSLPLGPYQAVDSVAAPATSEATATATTAPAALGATEAQAAEGSDYVLYGESGLVIQSYGAIALISPAALLYANAALAANEPRPLIAPVEPVAPVSNVRTVDAIA
jgi:hypothetical protein